jgi:hypothetical protein
MIDPYDGDRAARAAAEAARKAAEEAARKAAEDAARRAAAERAMQAAVERLRDRTIASVDLGRFGPSVSGAGAPAVISPSKPTYSPAEAARLAGTPAAKGDRWWEEPQPPGSDHVPVPVQPGETGTAIVDNWLRGGKAGIGMGSTAVYDAYMQQNGLGLVQMSRILSPQSAPAAQALLQQGDTEGYVNLLMHPALDAMADLHPGATFELLTVERGALGTSMPGPQQIYAPQTVVRMTEDGQAQDFVLDASQLFRPTSDTRVHDALAATPGGLDAWNQAEAGLQQSQGDAQATWDLLSGLPTDGADYNIALGVMTMDAESQVRFLTAYGQNSDMPLGILRPISTAPADQAILTVDATPIARGQNVASLATTVHDVAIDGLADSTALPPIGGLSQQQWRATLDQLAMHPPDDVTQLKQQLGQLTGGAITSDDLAALQTSDGNALPALLNLVQDHPPAVQFSDTLRLSILPGGRGIGPTYESLTYDPLANAVVVDTSLNRMLRDPAVQARLADNYAVGDIPMTIRIPLPEGAPTDWSHPTTEQFALLNQQIQTIGSASVFLHGYQSDRRVWETDMQRWMGLSPQPTIGIALSGMGSEGGFLGSGASPLTAKQYAFDTMEALDRLGLYGKHLDLYGHSMGGAALLQMGLATDRMVQAGATRPDVSYVLLQPAPSGDSVPFLTERWSRGLIAVQNDLGSAGWLGNVLSSFGNWVAAGPIVNDLIPGAPDYIKDVHASFAGEAGFPQLKATAAGLVLQAEPDPAEVQAFLNDNHVLVVAGTQDRIVSTAAVQGIFDGRVFEVPGNHYAHLPTDIAAENHFGDVETRVREFLSEDAR